MCQYIKFILEYDFHPDFAVKIGSGQTKNCVIDNAYRIRHDDRGILRYSIPATTVKGRLRSVFNRYRHVFPEITRKEEVKLFGESGRMGCLFFSDLLVDEAESKNFALGIHTSTAIDRFRKAAKNKTLHVEEYLYATGQTSFSGVVEGYYPTGNVQGNTVIPKDISYLMLSLLSTTSFGSNKTSGWGSGKIVLRSLRFGEYKIEGEKIKEVILERCKEEI